MGGGWGVLVHSLPLLAIVSYVSSTFIESYEDNLDWDLFRKIKNKGIANIMIHLTTTGDHLYSCIIHR